MTAHRRPEPALTYSGAGMCAGAGLLGVVEAAIPGGPQFSPVPTVIALVLAGAVLLFGRIVPRQALLGLGLAGAATISIGVATTHGYSDTAILYSWPALWVGYFYGTRATVLVLLWIGGGHAIALLSLSSGAGDLDHWCDVMTSVTIVAAVVRGLAIRNARLVDRLTAEARIDPLTGLLNRRGLGERFPLEIARSIREDRPLAVVAIDIDHFKRVNDDRGHDAGDRVIAWVAGVLAQESRGIDIAARVGGDEFVVVLPGAGAEQADDFADRVHRAVAAREPLTISAGVAAAWPATSAEALTAAADRALYAAKREGRDTTRAVAP